MARTVERVDFVRGIAFLSDGTPLVIKTWFEGDDPCEPEDADALLAGNDADGWYLVDLDGFEEC